MQISTTQVRFSRFVHVAPLWCAAFSLGLIGLGLYFALFDSPAELYQKQTVRIMYVHVPGAWMGLFIYTCMAFSSAAFLVWKRPLYGMVCRASAPIGATFTLLCLISGSFWGKPAWGGWWAWDARLTSMLILLFLYIGYMALANAFDNPARGTKAAAILVLVGWVNIPIIKFSVNWWSSLHQPSSMMKSGGPAIAPDMLRPLLLMAAGFTLYYLVVVLFRIRTEIADAHIRAARLRRIRE